MLLKFIRNKTRLKFKWCLYTVLYAVVSLSILELIRIINIKIAEERERFKSIASTLENNQKHDDASHKIGNISSDQIKHFDFNALQNATETPLSDNELSALYFNLFNQMGKRYTTFLTFTTELNAITIDDRHKRKLLKVVDEMNTQITKSSKAYHVNRAKQDRLYNKKRKERKKRIHLYLNAFDKLVKSKNKGAFINRYQKELKNASQNLFPRKQPVQTITETMFIASTLTPNFDQNANWSQKVVDPNENDQNHEIIKSVKLKQTKPPLRLNIATVACGWYDKYKAVVMIKSAVIFSQDTNLHVIVLTDASTKTAMALSLIRLKWSVNQLGWDFTFELVQIPYLFRFENQNGTRNSSDDGVKSVKTWQTCTLQRLFLPSLLPHIDSIIYLDAEVVILSNLTEMWLNFERRMTSKHIAALTADTEYPALGHYKIKSKIPFYGYGGLNADVMLLNLTRMRAFTFKNRALSVYARHKKNITFPDQDIFNIIFHDNPDKVYVLDCSYNLNRIHCGEGPKMHCLHNPNPGPICFCNSTLTRGLRAVHRGMSKIGLPQNDNLTFPFLRQLKSRFSRLNLLKHSVNGTIQELMKEFSTLEKQCFSLTPKTMYRNALAYIRRL